MILTAKVVCLFFAVAYGFACIARAIKGQPVSQGQNFAMSAGVAGFIALQWLL